MLYLFYINKRIHVLYTFGNIFSISYARYYIRSSKLTSLVRYEKLSTYFVIF